MIYRVENNCVVITIPEGKTMIQDGLEIPAPNWTCSIPLGDTEALKQYLTDGQINQLTGE